MNTKERSLLGSWIIWSAAYYMYYPFISIYLSRFVEESKLSLLFVVFQAVSLPLPLIGAKISKVNRILPIIIGMLVGGIGMIMLPFSRNILEVIIFMCLNYFIFLSLPSYYSLMSEIGEGTITRIWSLSILPSIVMPSVGGLIAQYLGLRWLFMIGGIVLATSFLPMVNLSYNPLNRISLNFKIGIRSFLPAILILPIAMEFPYIYLVVYDYFHLTKEIVGIIATSAEILGMVLSYLASKLISKKKYFLSLSLFLFSLTSLYFISPTIAIFFGCWESIVPLTLEYFSSRKTVYDFALINIMQGLGWIFGYLIDYLMPNISILLLSSCLIAFLLGLIILFIKD
ncbi:hypothetical protein GFS03_06605 [Sulfolobus sp. E5-1-F]|uniref:hypothetical protein n=1 Tax=Sulfolobaceae TaxID=118883 RepID=UPI001296EA81|nr:MULTISPECIES: hypothetical protein [unclassified Sulfolobus]QGA54268.1 hypothetical protein GFS03_06605 [Sulfolobus sp. E5-1-F]QGA69322.1 hypothetical protein GFS33_12015 [Sulfolobus sp. E11-6]